MQAKNFDFNDVVYSQYVKNIFAVLFAFAVINYASFSYAGERYFSIIDEQISSHPGSSGVIVLDKGEEALLTRAWLTDHAEKTIEVQYFIWSTDNIGILASEAFLRAAERGVKIRVIVDDILIDASDESLIALALHPNVEICIYNPKHSVGTSFFKRIFNMFSDFRGVNQRMHDKTFVVDGKVAIVGGRNMADEYFDYNQKYNFRDRDVLLMGDVVNEIQNSFNRFWDSKLTESVQQRFKGTALLAGKVDKKKVAKVYSELHTYAQSPENFRPEVRDAIMDLTVKFPELFKSTTWTDVQFINDMPGKNQETMSLGGGGLSTDALADLVNQAKKKIVIQSPYLVLSDEALKLFADARRRGVKIIVSTNSLASTDNLQAFSGYRNQREELLNMGIEIFEYMPYPEVQKELLQRYSQLKDNSPIFAIHAKSMVVDTSTIYIGTYNLDPRSQNLNTEVGIIASDRRLAKNVEKLIIRDIKKGNSWSADESPDKHASLGKRLKVFFWQLMPIKALL